ncbi:MAG: VOC family protein [Bacteroidota bacterium]
MKAFSNLAIIISLTFTYVSVQAQTELKFSPQQLVIMVPDVDASAQWYVEKLDFEMGKPFQVPEKGLTGRLVRKADFEIMFMRSKNMKPLPQYRKTSFEDLAVAGVKRIAFKVDNLKEFAESLKERGVNFDVPVVLFHDPDSGVKFYWCIIKDYNGNLVEFMEIL